MSKSTLAFGALAIGLICIGLLSINHSYDLGIKDKYSYFVGLGLWLCLGSALAIPPTVRSFSKEPLLKRHILPIAFWGLVPSILLVAAVMLETLK